MTYDKKALKQGQKYLFIWIFNTKSIAKWYPDTDISHNIFGQSNIKINFDSNKIGTHLA